MQSHEWVLAPCSRLAAYRAGARLGIVAECVAPGTPRVGRIREADDRSRPPRYAVEWRRDEDGDSSSDSPLVIAGVFLSPLDVDDVTVATTGDDHTIHVARVSDAAFDAHVGGAVSIWDSMHRPEHPRSSPSHASNTDRSVE